MKHSLLILLTFMSIFISNATSCNKGVEINNKENNNTMENEKIKITVNSKTFTAILFDNNSAKEFKKLLPTTITMNELNGNEKKYDFQNSLPTNPFNPETIKNGDLMLYGSKTLVLFYKTFPTYYSYTKLGKVIDVTGFASALGGGNVTVTFEME